MIRERLRSYLVELLWGKDEQDVPPPANGFDVRIRMNWPIYEESLVGYIEKELKRQWGGGVASVKIVRRG